VNLSLVWRDVEVRSDYWGLVSFPPWQATTHFLMNMQYARPNETVDEKPAGPSGAACELGTPLWCVELGGANRMRREEVAAGLSMRRKRQTPNKNKNSGTHHMDLINQWRD